MADFDLTQTDQQVQNILNDAQGAMGASAQTTLTTEYVMLKDTNGVYHKILKSSFTEAIRDVFAGLLVNNDKGTTINQIAAIASGDFGSVTPANLASVLGGMQYPNISNIRANSSNVDSLEIPGFYLHSDSVSTGGGSYGILEVQKANNWYEIQIDRTPTTGGIIVRARFRTKSDSTQQWGSWTAWGPCVSQ